MAHHAISENSKRHRSRSGFPKKPSNAKGGAVLYNYATAPRTHTFAPLPFHLLPQPSHFQIHINTYFHRQTLTRSKRWRRRRELRNRRIRAPRRRAPKSSVTKSGCHHERERRNSTDWWSRAFCLTVSPSDGGRPSVSPSPCLIPTKL